MKICTKCFAQKENHNFRNDNRRPGKLYCWCRTCESLHKKDQAIRNRESLRRGRQRRRVERKEWFIQFKKTLSCSKCGDNRWYVLDFHHKDKDDKKDHICKLMAGSYAIAKIMEEIAKCDVLCSNCHRELHYFERIGNGASEVIASV